MTAMLYNVLVQIDLERVADVIMMYTILDLRVDFAANKNRVSIFVP